MNIQWEVALQLPPTITDFKTVEKDWKTDLRKVGNSGGKKWKAQTAA